MTWYNGRFIINYQFMVWFYLKIWKPKCSQSWIDSKSCLISYSCTGKSFSEVLILASTNLQYDKRLSIELPVQYIKIPSLEHGENMRRTCCVQKLFFVLTFRTIYINNMFSTCSDTVLSLEFSCTGLVIQWTICCHTMG